MAFSVALQAIALGIMMLIPLMYGEALPGRRLIAALMGPPAAPAPPPPRSTEPQIRLTPKGVQQPQGMVEPRVIPPHAAIIREDPRPPAPFVGVVGVPGGTGDAARNYLLEVIKPPLPPPPPPAPTQEPLRLGGQVAAAKLLSQPKPVYPALARQARVQGTVRLEAVISKEGFIENLTVVSGHPLLIPAATEAVKQWRYQPTLLNGEPLEVITTVDVNFTLGG